MLEPKNSELLRTNRMLLGVSVAAVVLLGPVLILGYAAGYHTARENCSQGASGTALASPQLSALTSSPTAPKRTAPAIPAERGNSGESPPGKVYLQLVAAAKSRSAVIIDALRSDGFPVITSDIPEKPAFHRILIGPLYEGEVAKMRADLQRKGFPGDSAIERKF